MFGFDMLDAFIGLITVYLTLSLIVTAIGEGVSQVLCFRRRILNLSIERLVGQDLAPDIFEHRRFGARELRTVRFISKSACRSKRNKRAVAGALLEPCL